jgi:hypothetical protein
MLPSVRHSALRLISNPHGPLSVVLVFRKLARPVLVYMNRSNAVVFVVVQSHGDMFFGVFRRMRSASAFYVRPFLLNFCMEFLT